MNSPLIICNKLKHVLLFILDDHKCLDVTFLEERDKTIFFIKTSAHNSAKIMDHQGMLFRAIKTLLYCSLNTFSIGLVVDIQK